ncbi:lyase family protein [Qingshengfaniella alkalisoli]|uniref:Fumarate lyase N-terminal domain-containing protein n=1 Tax=Qingshengfaniella alkalisoli TaxID=2599296 RepID=A0A5B8I6F6_9RHOB|nr:lyase family protein [Qingshengfaniella alkalisoli]QDY69085.1 hypothetical protein FPZ52_05185 [Qingshengfaniella alkalisoli]
MTVSLADSPLWQNLFGDAEIAALLGDDALVAAMVRVEGELARAQGVVGVIPAEAGNRLAAALEGCRVELSDLAGKTASDGVVVPALLASLRNQIPPELVQYLHWGATSQDVVDTATMVQLRVVSDLLIERAQRLLDRLCDMASEHNQTVMLARTRTQAAMPTTFGAVAAIWGQGILPFQARMLAWQKGACRISLHGAAGTDAAMGVWAPQVRKHFAQALGLADSDSAWHASRDGVASLGAALTLLAGSLGKIGQDAALLAQTEINELKLQGGASSTMPHKSNPVAAEALVTLARTSARLQGALFDAQIHNHQRDGAAWAEEWHSLRQLCVAVGAALNNANAMLKTAKPDTDRMLRNLTDAGEGIFAEAAVFALSRIMPRPDAQSAVKEAIGTDGSMREVLKNAHPEIDWPQVFDPLNAAGRAPDMAREFCALVAPKQRSKSE